MFVYIWLLNVQCLIFYDKMLYIISYIYSNVLTVRMCSNEPCLKICNIINQFNLNVLVPILCFHALGDLILRVNDMPIT